MKLRRRSARASRSLQLDIAEKRLPRRSHQDQDEVPGQDEGARLPRLDDPEHARRDDVMRLLDKDMLMLDMTKLGFENRAEVVREAIFRPTAWSGDGPTGSGKTNTLYSALSASTPRGQHPDRRGPGRVPAHRHQPGADERAIGLNFAAPALFCARPDIVLVGEIRDFETARSRSRPH